MVREGNCIVERFGYWRPAYVLWRCFYIIYDIPRKDCTKFNRLINHLPEKWITNFREVNHDIYGKILQDILRSKKVSRFFFWLWWRRNLLALWKNNGKAMSVQNPMIGKKYTPACIIALLKQNWDPFILHIFIDWCQPINLYGKKKEIMIFVPFVMNLIQFHTCFLNVKRS